MSTVSSKLLLPILRGLENEELGKIITDLDARIGLRLQMAGSRSEELSASPYGVADQVAQSSLDVVHTVKDDSMKAERPRREDVVPLVIDEDGIVWIGADLPEHQPVEPKVWLSNPSVCRREYLVKNGPVGVLSPKNLVIGLRDVRHSEDAQRPVRFRLEGANKLDEVNIRLQ